MKILNFRLVFILCLYFALFGCAHSGKWDKTDYSLLAATTTVGVVDYLQTSVIVKNPTKYSESNHILGPHPSQDNVNLFFVGTFISTVVIAELLPSTWRKIWLSLAFGMSANTVYKNYNIGIRF